LAFDQRGHGDSGWSSRGEYSISAYSSDVGAVLEHFEARRCLLVGHSLGGLSAFAYAIDHPELSGLVIVDLAQQMQSAGIVRVRAMIESQLSFPSLDAMIEHVGGGSARRDDELFRLSVAGNARQLADGSWSWKFDPRFNPGDLNEAQRLFPRAAEVTCPVLVAHGECSDIVDASGARELADQFPDGRSAVIPEARHNIHHDNPLGLADRLMQFRTEIGI
jgi:pimeloyl-ACP methyl ester carboxylesterase